MTALNDERFAGEPQNVLGEEERVRAASPVARKASKSAVVNNIQVLRAIAAFMVVFHHIRDYANTQAPGSFPTQVGAAGVDIFFVISGFVMVLTAVDGSLSPGEFIRRRLIRIVPLYWLFTALMTVLLMAGLHPGGVHGWSWSNILASLLFLPQVRADGWEGPVLAVGWTLNYEIFFYAVFALGLLYARGRQLVALVGSVFASLVVFGLIVSFFRGADTSYPFRFYTDPILFEFFAGAVIGLIYMGEARLTEMPMDPLRLRKIGWAMLLGGVLFLSISAFNNPRIEVLRELTFGMPAMLIVGGAVVLEKTGLSVASRFALLLGAASYVIYLAHVFVLQTVEKLSVKLLPQSPAVIVMTIVAGLVAVTVAGVILHRFVELPLIRLFRTRPPPELRRAEMNAAQG